MTFYLATKTLEAIDTALNRDGGALYRSFLARTLPLCSDAYDSRPQTDDYKSNVLGVNAIGDECERKLWYKFHWAPKTKPIPAKEEPMETSSARMVRLFNRGHLEEGRMAALLLMIGCKFHQYDERGQQFKLKLLGGHYRGAIDGVIEGCPDIPDEPILAELKTFNEKGYTELVKNGMRVAEPEHYAQTTTYMKGWGLRYALYFATNKNTDAIHAEIVPANESAGQSYNDRAERVVFSPRPPPRLQNASRAFWKCRFCDFNPVCFGLKPFERNCRSCINSQPLPDGGWVCRSTGEVLDREAQLKGCPAWSVRK